MKKEKWYQGSYRRFLVDSHITDDKPEFMAQFEPSQFVDSIKRAHVDSAMICACCHNGNCYYPTRVGHMHKNLHGRDVFGENVRLLRKEGIVPVAYYTVIYHNESAQKHSDWRLTYKDGRQHDGRYW